MTVGKVEGYKTPPVQVKGFLLPGVERQEKLARKKVMGDGPISHGASEGQTFWVNKSEAAGGRPEKDPVFRKINVYGGTETYIAGVCHGTKSSTKHTPSA